MDEPVFESTLKARLFVAGQVASSVFSLGFALWALVQADDLRAWVQESDGAPVPGFRWGIALSFGWTALQLATLWAWPSDRGWVFKMYDQVAVYRRWSRATWSAAGKAGGNVRLALVLRPVAILLTLSPFLALPLAALGLFAGADGEASGDAVLAAVYFAAFMLAGGVAWWHGTVWMNHLREKGVVDEPSGARVFTASLDRWPFTFKPVQDAETELLRLRAAYSLGVLLFVWIGGFLLVTAVSQH
ncbi:MAG TPA: hypothetical protein VG318_12710 [Actinomycetota bacterium]|nr:hypothetical protein [Actinomycetota bacterium]